MTPPSPPLFVGREAELKALTHWLDSDDRKPILISGMGGMGKTALVTRFVTDRYADDRIAWLSFYSEPDAQTALDTFFGRIQEQTPQVIVVDDIDHAALNLVAPFVSRVQHTFPSIPVILTSRYAVDVIDAQSLALDSLSDEAAVSLLHDRLGAGRDLQLRELAQTLGNHPLALAIVSGLAKDRPIGPLIEELRKRLYELERDVPEPPASIIEAAKPKIIIATDALVERLQKQPDDVYKLPPRQFEELIASLLDDMGWEVHLTQQTRDGGRDILAYLNTDVARLLFLVEAKRYNPKRPVGVELVRNLYGTLCHEQANSAMLVTSSYFSPDAKEFQKQHVYQISLKDYQDIVKWIGNFKKHR
jgi:restriction system protein